MKLFCDSYCCKKLFPYDKVKYTDIGYSVGWCHVTSVERNTCWNENKSRFTPMLLRVTLKKNSGTRIKFFKKKEKNPLKAVKK